MQNQNTDNSNLKNLTREELTVQLKPLYEEEIYPQLSDQEQADTDLDKVVAGAYELLHGQSSQGKTATSLSVEGENWHSQVALAQPELSPCLIAVGFVIADALAIVFQFAGINQAESRAAARAILSELGQDTIRGIQATLHDFNTASSALEKAKLMWKIVSETYKVLGIKGIIGAIKDSMKWYDWAITAVTITAQLTAWFATDGLALAAEIALEGVYIVQFTEDIIKAKTACQD